MIEQVMLEAEKRLIARDVLADLPEWFGIQESLEGYVQESGKLPFFAARIGGEAVGFIALKETSPVTAELCVMGVKKAYHRKGIGRRLVNAFLECARDKGYRYAQVKTVAGGLYPEYDDTRLFYESMGFCELEVFPTLWEENNPCLIMVMKL